MSTTTEQPTYGRSVCCVGATSGWHLDRENSRMVFCRESHCHRPHYMVKSIAKSVLTAWLLENHPEKLSHDKRVVSAFGGGGSF